MRKFKSAISMIIALAFVILCITNCSDEPATTAATNTEPPVTSTTHMMLQGCDQGIKITLKNVRDAGIEVFQGNNRLPLRIETDNDKTVYIWPFAANGTEYIVKLNGQDKTNNQWFENETGRVTALGGTPWNDCVDVDKFMQSTLTGIYDTNMTTPTHKAKLASTTIQNPRDIIKSSLVSKAEFEFILVLGDDPSIGRETWYSGEAFDTNDSSRVTGASNGSLGTTLQNYINIPVINWHRGETGEGAITSELREEFDYTYKFRARIKFYVTSQGYDLSGRFVTDEIASVPYAYPPNIDGNSNVKVLARPQLEPLTGAQYAASGDYNKNFMKINNNQFSGGSLSLNAIKYGDGSSSNTFSDWDDYDTMTITVQGDNEKEIMIYALNKATGATQVLTSVNIEPFEHFSATIFKEDLDRFFPYSLADSNKAILIKAHGDCTYKFTSIKFMKYDTLEDHVIFDPEATANASFNYGNNAQLVTLDDGHKYLKVTTASQITDTSMSDTVVNIPSHVVPEGYARIKAKCFVADNKHTTTTSATGYYTFCFLIGAEDDYCTFMQRPLFDTVTNYKGNDYVDNLMRCQGVLPYDGMSVNKLWVWANNGRLQEDGLSKAADFADLTGKEFYIGRIIAYTPD